VGFLSLLRGDGSRVKKIKKITKNNAKKLIFFFKVAFCFCFFFFPRGFLFLWLARVHLFCRKTKILTHNKKNKTITQSYFSGVGGRFFYLCCCFFFQKVEKKLF